MIKYLVVQLDDTSTSFCHYPVVATDRRLISLDILKKAIFWGMKENVIFQFLYPDYELPQEYKDVISPVYRANIVSNRNEDTCLAEDADVVVINNLKDVQLDNLRKDCSYVVRGCFTELTAHPDIIAEMLPNVDRLTLVPTDVENFNNSVASDYEDLLKRLSDAIKSEYEKEHQVQVNVLTDRILLETMNNCNAGVESIALCPDGRFYVCPAFYNDGAHNAIGDVESGPIIPNQQLYRLDHAPICRKCDAWQCKRCVWLNRKMTLEVNTPSHEQCVMAHTEREASRGLLAELKELGSFMPGKDIAELDYNDPFDKLEK